MKRARPWAIKPRRSRCRIGAATTSRRNLVAIGQENITVCLTWASWQVRGGRREKSLKMHGCNYYGRTTTRSAPFAIFDRQDILQLALDLDVPVPKEYGEIAKNADGKLYTTRAQRTGCTMCGFGIHMEGRPHRFDILREENPKEWEFWMKHVCRDEDGNWYGWGRVLDYIDIGWEDVPQATTQMTMNELL